MLYTKCLRITALLSLVLGLLLIPSAAVLADGYPDKPVSMIVTYSPGGATDFQARIVTMLAGDPKLLGQPIVIINKPGAGGRVGWNWFVSKGTKDGYTLASYNVPHFIAQSIMFKTKYNIDTFEPVANWGSDPAVLIVPKDSPFNNAKDLVSFAKKNPGKVTVSGAGMYVGHHIATLQLMKVAGVKLTYIPEAGGVPAMQSVISGKVKAGFNNLSDSYRNKDRIKILGVADLERHSFLPDVPTFKEQGFEVDNSSVNYRGICLPKGAPPEVIASLAEVTPKMFGHPKTLGKMKSSGSPVKILSRDEVIKMFKEREAYLKDLLKDLKKK